MIITIKKTIFNFRDFVSGYPIKSTNYNFYVLFRVWDSKIKS